MRFTGVAPTLRNVGGAVREVLRRQQLETGFSKEPFVLARRYEEIESNRTADCELFMRNRSCDHHRIGKQSSPFGTQDAMPLTKDREPLTDMTHGIVRQNGVKIPRRKRQRRAGVGNSEVDAIAYSSIRCQCNRIANSMLVYVDAGDAASALQCQVNSRAAGTAAHLEYF